MNVDLGIWERLNRVIIFLLFIAGVLGVAMWYRPLIARNEGMRRAILQLEKEIKIEEEQSRQLNRAIKSIHDPKTVERLLRELGYARPDEMIVRFEEAPKAPPAPSAGR